MKKILGLFFVMLIICGVSYGETTRNIKVGFLNTQCIAINDAIVVDTSVEKNFGKWSLEGGLSEYVTSIDEVDSINLLDFHTTIYLNTKYDLQFGLGVGYIITLMNPRYDCDDELQGHVVVRKNFKNFFLEFKYTHADLDLETGLDYDAEIESHSRLDNLQFLIGKKIEW